MKWCPRINQVPPDTISGFLNLSKQNAIPVNLKKSLAVTFLASLGRGPAVPSLLRALCPGAAPILGEAPAAAFNLKETRCALAYVGQSSGRVGLLSASWGAAGWRRWPAGLISTYLSAPLRPIFVCIWYSDNTGGQGRAFVLVLPRQLGTLQTAKIYPISL